MLPFEIKLLLENYLDINLLRMEKQSFKMWHVHIGSATTQYNIKYRFANIRRKNVIAVNRAIFMFMPVLLLIA